MELKSGVSAIRQRPALVLVRPVQGRYYITQGAGMGPV